MSKRIEDIRFQTNDNFKALIVHDADCYKNDHLFFCWMKDFTTPPFTRMVIYQGCKTEKYFEDFSEVASSGMETGNDIYINEADEYNSVNIWLTRYAANQGWGPDISEPVDPEDNEEPFPDDDDDDEFCEYPEDEEDR